MLNQAFRTTGIFYVLVSLAISLTTEAMAQDSQPTEDNNAQEDDSVLLEVITILGESPLTADNETGSRLGLTVKETPATVEVIEGDAIRERLDTSVTEAVTRSAGFSFNSHHANGGLNMSARGFSGQESVTKLFDGANNYNAYNTVTFPFDTWGVERIEVLKGPASVLYGEGGIGGAYNVIPKRPQQEQSGDLRISTGGDDTRFLGVGLTGGLTDNLAYRLDYSNRQSDNWVERADSKTEMISASLAVQVTEDFGLTARYDYGYQEPMPYSGTPLVDGGFPTELLKKNYDVSDGLIRHKEGAARIKADWNISERLSVQSELFRLDSDRFWKALDWYRYDRAAGTVERRWPLIIAHDIEHNGLRTNLVFDAGDGGRKLKTSVGFEINDVTFIRPTNFGGGNPNRVDWDYENGCSEDSSGDCDLVDAFNFNPDLFSDLTNSVARTETVSDVAQAAVFAEGQVGVTDSLTLVLGLRHENVEGDYTDFSDPPTFGQDLDALTGRAGLVFDLNDATVLYGSYATGATHPTGGIVRVRRANHRADFTETEQIEVGIKQSLLDNRFHWTLALFDIVKNNLIVPSPDPTNPDRQSVIPEKTSQGVEFSLAFALTNALKVTANGALVDVDRTSEGLWDPVEAPEETYNLGLAWAPLDKLQLLADARYVGERFHPVMPSLPSYTVVDTSARWHFNQDLSMVLRIDNVFDELYADTAYYWHDAPAWLVGKPRTFNLSLDYHF